MDDAEIKPENAQKQSRGSRKRNGKSASLIRQKIEERGINSARKRDSFKDENNNHYTTVAQPTESGARKAEHRSINDPHLFDFSRRKRREVSEPPRFNSLATQKLF